jgi:putative radical SAM enzyme (TIGR03279 family)
VKIITLDVAGTGRECGLQPGDEIQRINGAPVRDILDYRFLIADDAIEMEVRRGGEPIIFDIEKDADDSLGLNFEPLKIRRCGNDCIFCFVDQNPKNMRSTMYFRDEDFRLSFLSGHYVTLSNMSRADLERIVRQRLTPLFISVHATEPQMRKFLLGIKFDDRLLDKFDYLTQNGIELHTQIVLCPELNDGEVLRRTLTDLERYHPHLRSVAVVPVGLTRHREGLTAIKPVTKEYAKNFLRIADEYAAEFYQRLGMNFIYPSDEFYLMADEPIPPASRYDAFEQMENGVGMLRDLVDDFNNRQINCIPKHLPKPAKVTLVTAILAGEFIAENILPRLQQIKNFTPELAVVINQFYGDTIRVTGLLTGQDIYAELKARDLGAAVFLPKSCLNDKQIFLDDWTLAELQAKLGVPVVPLKNDFAGIFEFLKTGKVTTFEAPKEFEFDLTNEEA